MKAIILAAGQGKRLKKLVLNRPKPLLKISNTTIIEYLVECLREVGIKKIIVVTGYKSKLIKKTLGNSVKYIFNKKYKTTNSIYSLYLAKKQLFNSNFILTNGDVFISKDYFARMINEKQSITCGIKRKKYLFGEMNMILKRNYIKEISKTTNPKLTNAESAQISYFVKKDSKILFNKIDKLIKNKLYHLFPASAYKDVLNKSKMRIKFVNPLHWFEIDNKNDLMKIRKTLNSKIKLKNFKNCK